VGPFGAGRENSCLATRGSALNGPGFWRGSFAAACFWQRAGNRNDYLERHISGMERLHFRQKALHVNQINIRGK